MNPRTILWLALALGIQGVYICLRIYGNLKEFVPETILLLLISGVLYLVSCYLSIRSEPDKFRRNHFILLAGAAVLFRLTVWPLAPWLSEDVFRYRWEGKVADAGENPYTLSPNDPRAARFRDSSFARIPGQDFRPVYGPVTELIQRLNYRIAATLSQDPERQAFWFKLPAAMFDLFTIALLWRWLRLRGLPSERIVIYAWSPLSVIEFWGNGHNDALAVCLLAGALVAATASRWALSFVHLGLSIAAKLWPAFLFPLFVGWTGRMPARWRQFWIAPVVVGLTILPFLDGLFDVLRDNLRFTSGFLGGWRNNDSLFGLLLWLSNGDLYTAKKVAFAIVCATVAGVTLAKWPLEKACLAVLTVLLLVSANCHPWYLTWLLPFLVVEPVPPILLWTALVPLAHTPVMLWSTAGIWDGSTPIRWLEYVPVLGWFAASGLLQLIRHSRRGSGVTAQADPDNV